MADRDMTKREEAWVARLQRSLDAMPPGLSLFCDGMGITVMDERAGDAAQEPETRRDHVLADVRCDRIGAGDW